MRKIACCSGIRRAVFFLEKFHKKLENTFLYLFFEYIVELGVTLKMFLVAYKCMQRLPVRYLVIIEFRARIRLSGINRIFPGGREDTLVIPLTPGYTQLGVCRNPLFQKWIVTKKRRRYLYM